MVFGLQCGSFIGTCCMEMLKCIAEAVMEHRGIGMKDVGIVDVIDDFNFV